jgi:hypothetical protein
MKKKPNKKYHLLTHSSNSKNYTFHLQFFESIWDKNIFDNNMILNLWHLEYKEFYVSF